MPLKPEPSKRPSLPALVIVVQALLFILSVALSESFREQEGSAGIVLIAARLAGLALALSCIFFPSLTVAICIFTTVALFEAWLPTGKYYFLCFIAIGIMILWFRVGRPFIGWLGVLLIVLAGCVFFNFLRDTHSDDNKPLLSLCTYFGCGGIMCGVASSKRGLSVHWNLVALSTGAAAAYTLLASLLRAYLFFDFDLLGSSAIARLGTMGLGSSNTAAAGWATGALAWGVYMATGGKKWLAICGGITCLTGVLMTRTLGASLGLALCLPFVIYRCLSGTRWILAIAASAAPIVLLGVSIVTGMAHRFAGDERDLETFSFRTETWRSSINALQTRPTGRTLYEWGEVAVAAKFGNVELALTPHNAVLQAGAFGGVAGFLACLGVMLGTLHTLVSRGRAYSSWHLMSFFTILSLMTIDVWYFYPVLIVSMQNAPVKDVTSFVN